MQRPEWDAGHNARLIEFGVYDPADFDIGHAVELLDGDHDIFGDGTIRAVLTPGHTSGHQSLVIEGKTILVGDACYCRLALDLDALPSYSYDGDRQRETFTWLRAQEAAARSWCSPTTSRSGKTEWAPAALFDRLVTKRSGGLGQRGSRMITGI